MTTRIAVVTGSNKGIGFAIVKKLANNYDGIVYLTARNKELGLKAVEILKSQGIMVNFHQLDIDNIHSINKFADYIKENYKGLDILINNAAIAYLHHKNDPTPVFEQVENTIRINFTGTLNVCKALFPLLRPHARVVNVSSRLGFLSTLKDQSLINKLTNQTASIEEIVNLMQKYVNLAKFGKHEEINPNSYSMSKVGINLLTEVQQKLFDNDERGDIIVNSATPGYVATSMTDFKGTLTIEEGAETPFFLALLKTNKISEKGVFWADKNVIDWKNLDNKL